MPKKRKVTNAVVPNGVGFLACYKGRTIAYEQTFNKLANRAEVKSLLGNKELLIRHTVPEGLIAIY